MATDASAALQPHLSRSAIPPQPPSGPEEAEAVLAPWIDPAEIAALRAAGTLR
jgi:hypothetical protein